MCFYYKYYNYVSLVFGAENKRHCIIYIVYLIANVFCVSLRIWLCIHGTTLRLSLYDVLIAWIERRLALAAFVVSVQRNRFCTMGAFSWQKSPVKILFARKVQNGGSKTSAFRHLAAGASPRPTLL